MGRTRHQSQSLQVEWNALKNSIKQMRTYQYVHVARRAGIKHLWRRERIVRTIDQTLPQRTRPWRPGVADSPAEVHVLVRCQDVRLALWSLKSFYHQSGVDWPLVFHQGGTMTRRDWCALTEKFPDAYCLYRRQADAVVTELTKERGLPNSESARHLGPMLRKLLDPLLLSAATTLLVLDTDVLFFAPPVELLAAAGQPSHANTFNRDDKAFPYSVSPEQAAARFGISPIPHLNAGLALLNRAAMDLKRVDTYLSDPGVLSSPFFAEQTVHALHSAEFGHRLLPETYACSNRPGLTTDNGDPLIAKHYVETPRPLLYDEGMTQLIHQHTVPAMRNNHAC